MNLCHRLPTEIKLLWIHTISVHRSWITDIVENVLNETTLFSTYVNNKSFIIFFGDSPFIKHNYIIIKQKLTIL